MTVGTNQNRNENNQAVLTAAPCDVKLTRFTANQCTGHTGFVYSI